MKIQIELEYTEIELINKVLTQELNSSVEIDTNQHRSEIRNIIKELDEQKREAIIPQE